MPISNYSPSGSYQDAFANAGTEITVAASPVLFGPFHMGDFQGIQVWVERSDDGASGTLAVELLFPDYATGDNEDIVDGAGNQVAMNNFAAGENARRLLQVHPTAGPAPADDADGVFAVGTTGAAQTYFRQPMPSEFYVEMTAATDTSTIAGTLVFLR